VSERNFKKERGTLETRAKNSPAGLTNERSTLPPLAAFWLIDPPYVIHAARAVALTSPSITAGGAAERFATGFQKKTSGFL
jgi:hypothetical protein